HHGSMLPMFESRPSMRQGFGWIFSALLALTALASHAEAVRADPAPFDLAGPDLAITVTRGQKTLPITQVPNLAPGHKLWIQAGFPESQSAHYLMVAAFLRGATNPPPSSWFYPCETWTAKCLQKGLTVTVPPEAEQVLVFLAPETG